MVLVTLRRDVRGLSVPQAVDAGLGVDGQPVTAAMRLMPLAEALATEFDCDAHAVAYEVVGPDGQRLSRAPRLRKEALARTRELGGDVVCPVALVDLDLRHMGLPPWWSELTPEQAAEVKARVLVPPPGIAPWTYAYATRGGVRFAHVLALPVPAGPGFEALLGRAHDAYYAAGLPVDRACSDWTRLYRLPRVTRDGGPTWAAPYFWLVDRSDDDLTYWVPSPDDLVARPEPERQVQVATLDGRPDDTEADDLVWVMADGGRRELTPDAARAELLLRSSAVHPYVFGHVAFARAGQRHAKLLKVVGILVQVLRPWATRELTYALALQAVRMLEQDEDWAAKAWEMTCSFWAREPASPPPPSPPSPEEPEPAPEEPPGELHLDKDGRPYPSPHNVRVGVGMLGASLSYDEFADRCLVSGLEGYGPTADDAAYTRLWLACEEQLGIRLGRDKFWAVLSDLARARRVHPPREYLTSLAWDGVPRVSGWLPTYMGAEDTPLNREVGLRFLVAAARRILEPGTKVDEMLVLEGPQGTWKSSAVRALSPREDWFTDSLPLGAESREVLEVTAGKWIVEASDMHGMTRKGVEALKAFLSKTHDRARKAYERVPSEHPRHFVIVGTTNADHYLTDSTGNRRFWPVRVGEVRLASLARDRDQLWAEAVHLVRAGESHRMDPRFYADVADAQAEREVQDPYEEILSELLPVAGRVRARDAWELVGMPRDRRTQGDSTRLGQAMRRLGWRRGKARVNGRVVWCYYSGAESPGTLRWYKSQRVSETSSRLVPDDSAQ